MEGAGSARPRDRSGRAVTSVRGSAAASVDGSRLTGSIAR